MASILRNVTLTAVSTVLPSGRVHAEDEYTYYGGNREQAAKVAKASGLHTRRTAGPDVTALDLCRQAAERLFAETGVSPGSIDALLFVSHTPDYPLPASATILQHLLGLSSDCLTMDMNVGCAAFVNGLWIGGGMIASGAAKRVLLLVGDTPTRFLDPANRVTLPVFGDAGTASLLEYDPTAPPMHFLFGTDGAKHQALVIPGGGSRIPQREDEGPQSPFNIQVRDGKGNPWRVGGYGSIWMSGMAIYAFGVTVVPKHLRRHLEETGLAPGDLDHLLLHQANKVIIDQLVQKLGLAPEKAPYAAMSRYGNLGGASIPSLICDHFGPGGEGEGLQGREDQARTMLCGFGAGLCWSSCLLSLGRCRVLAIRDYEPRQDSRTRAENIAYWHKKFAGACQADA